MYVNYAKMATCYKEYEEKSPFVHFRQKVVDQTMHEFKIGNSVIKTVDRYRYLVVMLEECLDYERVVECLAVGGGPVFGALNTKFKCVKNIGKLIVTCTKLFENCVIPVLRVVLLMWAIYKIPNNYRLD